MAESRSIPESEFRVLAERAGLRLTPEELAHLRPIYDHFARPVALLHELDLGEEDMAVAFPPTWDPPCERTEVIR